MSNEFNPSNLFGKAALLFIAAAFLASHIVGWLAFVGVFIGLYYGLHIINALDRRNIRDRRKGRNGRR